MHSSTPVCTRITDSTTWPSVKVFPIVRNRANKYFFHKSGAQSTSPQKSCNIYKLSLFPSRKLSQTTFRLCWAAPGIRLARGGAYLMACSRCALRISGFWLRLAMMSANEAPATALCTLTARRVRLRVVWNTETERQHQTVHKQTLHFKLGVTIKRGHPGQFGE